MGNGKGADDWKPAADAAMDRYAATGEERAFGELYDLLAPRLHAFLARRAPSAARAEDLLQQTFLQMHRARSHFARGAAVMPWAFAIARRLLIDGLRKGEKECLVDDEHTPAEVPCLGDSPDRLLAKRRLARRVAEELHKLPPAQRLACDLIQREGLSVAEAAQVLGTTETAVKLQAHRAYKALRERLGEEAHEALGEEP